MEVADVMEFVSLFHVYEIDSLLSVRPARSSISQSSKIKYITTESTHFI